MSLVSICQTDSHGTFVKNRPTLFKLMVRLIQRPAPLCTSTVADSLPPCSGPIVHTSTGATAVLCWLERAILGRHVERNPEQTCVKKIA